MGFTHWIGGAFASAGHCGLAGGLRIVGVGVFT